MPAMKATTECWGCSAPHVPKKRRPPKPPRRSEWTGLAQSNECRSGGPQSRARGIKTTKPRSPRSPRRRSKPQRHRDTEKRISRCLRVSVSLFLWSIRFAREEGIELTTNFTAAVNVELQPGVVEETVGQLSVSGGYVQRRSGNFFLDNNLAVGPSDFMSYCVAAPLNPRRLEIDTVSGRPYNSEP